MKSKEHILAMTVQINDNKTDVINVYEGDDASDLAEKFTKMHNLDE